MNYTVSEKKKPDTDQTVGLRELEEGRYEITLEGKTIEVDAARSGRLVYSIIEDGQQFEVLVDESGAHGFDLLVGGHLYHLEAIDERTQLLAGASAAVVTGPQLVEAEMPGKVVKIHVAAGAEVQEGDGVLVIEAMKMENEITSPIDGSVREIVVSEGDTVEAGTPLFTVDPPPAEEPS